MLKKWMERLLLTLCVVLFLTTPGTSLAAGTEGFTYEVMDDGTACIMSCSLTGDVRIPETIDGYTVTALNKQLFYNKRGITSVFVPASVKQFGRDPVIAKQDNNTFAYVFSYCWQLQKIEVDPANTTFRSVDGVLYSKDLRILYNYPCGKTGESYIIREETVDLDCTSFASCKIKTLYIEGYDVGWRGYTFYNDSQMTVYYKSGGGTGSRAMLDIGSGNTADKERYPTFVEYGTPKPETEHEENGLGTPTGVKAERTSEGLKLTWRAAKNADIYYIYKRSGDFIISSKPYAQTSDTCFIDTNFTWETMDFFSYYVDSVDLDDSGQNVLKTLHANTLYYMSFPVVKNVSGRNSGSAEVTLNWDPIETKQVDTGYEIWYTNNNQIPGIDQEACLRITDIKQTEAVIKNIVPGTWTFYVRPFMRMLGDYGISYLHEFWSEPTVVKVEGKVDQTTSKGGIYNLNHKNNTAILIGLTDLHTTSLTIPDTVKANGAKYKVTTIADYLCKGKPKLKTVIIGKNVKTIGKEAFRECVGLESITIKTKLLTNKTIGDNAFLDIIEKAKIICPSSKLKEYKKVLRVKGVSKKAKFTK